MHDDRYRPKNCSFPSSDTMGPANECRTNMLHPKWTRDWWLKADNSIGIPLLLSCRFDVKYLYITLLKAGARHIAKTATLSARIGANNLSLVFNLFHHSLRNRRYCPLLTFTSNQSSKLCRSSFRYDSLLLLAFLIFSYCHIAAQQMEEVLKVSVNIKGRINFFHLTLFASTPPDSRISFSLTSGPNF